MDPIVDIRLRQDCGWVGGPRTWCRGRAFRGDKLLSAPMLVRQFEAAEDRGALVALARSLTGHYAIVGQGPAGAFAVVDRVRSFPVFFACSDKALVLTDSPSLVTSDKPACPPSREALVDFAYCGYVTGQATLVGDVSQVPAATILSADEGSQSHGGVTMESYDSFAPELRQEPRLSRSALLEAALDSLSRAIDRLLVLLDGRTVVIPLSSGYDSRLLAMMVKRAGYDRVVCFSYGVPGNFESTISQAVSGELGFSWLFVPYDVRKWAQWTQSAAWRDYVEMAHVGVSLPMLQGWPSAGELAHQRQLPDDAVFVPGLVGGLVSGYYANADLATSQTATLADAAARVEADLYCLWWNEPERAIDMVGVKERIAASLNATHGDERAAAASAYEEWGWREDQAKLVVNAVRAYDYWGYEWWLPFADRDVLDFWQTVPYAERAGRRLYIRLVLDHVPDLLAASQRSVLRQRKPEEHPARVLLRRMDGRRVLRGLRDRMVRPVDGDTEYSSHHLAWWGAVDRAEFDREFTGRETVYSFLTQMMLRERYGWVRGQGRD